MQGIGLVPSVWFHRSGSERYATTPKRIAGYGPPPPVVKICQCCIGSARAAGLAQAGPALRAVDDFAGASTRQPHPLPDAAIHDDEGSPPLTPSPLSPFPLLRVSPLVLRFVFYGPVRRGSAVIIVLELRNKMGSTVSVSS